jgi:DNA-binding NarL/FixJ family response regulator
MKTKVLIADDHSVVRQGLKTFLTLDPELEVVGTARSGAEAVRMAHQVKPEVVLLDLFMPEMDGFETTLVLRRELPETRVLVLTSVLEETSIARALRAGANGYILKSMEAPELCRAVKSASNSQVLVSPEVADLLADKLRITHMPSPESLTERETEVLRLVARGKANKEIAYELKLSEGTIKTHVSVILAKLGLQSRTQAAIYASNIGLVGFSGDYYESLSQSA